MNLADLTALDIAGTAGVAVAAYLIIRRIWTAARNAGRGLRKLVHFADDWFGEPERDGVPARPGVMERISAIETDGAATRDDVRGLVERVDRVEHELRPNSGASLRDAIDRVENAVADTPNTKPAKEKR
ncbi:hypothetical protein ACFQ05_11815 [Amycolatopsis umgeniensis]|uniref:Uncharacterized protein n=1 Tax=Amycolatopsis umgeniensis TaxID=336628 RepID=A0A841B1K0_9PSEU|nr:MULTISPECIES: hypothetical protein [Amycolatopsis]MBB5853986.1 hypothetical protein [Amycolatopsis umgeniensis]QFU94673.1 hypothetical protein YIM_47740 [Amycolatopsis sp. YIM 10]